MGNGRHRVPQWCAFGGMVSFIIFICVIMTRFNNFLWDYDDYEPDKLSLSGHLESWERNTAEEYMLKLYTPNHRSKAPSIRYYEFEISHRSTYIGGVHRVLTVINGQYPGPLIEAVAGDTVIVKVVNKITEKTSEPQQGTSLHFHGQLMNGTNYYDGSVGFTQCGILPGSSYTYVIETDLPGTFWYHSHWDLQQVEGLVGPMVVHERIPFESASVGHMGHKKTREKDSNTQEAVLLLTDLYDRPAQDLLLDYMEPWIGGTEEPMPDIALTQGKSQASISVEKGKNLRLRIINACSYTAFLVKRDTSPLRVIEADSTMLQPTDVPDLMIFPSQRYSIIVDLTSSNSVWLHTTPQISFYGSDPLESSSLMRSSGDLRTLLFTRGSSIKKPMLHKDMQAKEENLIEPYFQPLSSYGTNKAPLRADFTSYIDITMTRLASGEVAGALNNQVYLETPSKNILHSLLALLTPKEKWQQNIPKHHTHHKPENSIKTLLSVDEIKTVDLVIRNYDDGPHPIHLHGHGAWIISRGNVTSMSPAWIAPEPLKRDTIWLPENEWVRIRIIIDNPGVWALHCHIPWHSRTGMKGAILALPSKLAQQKPPSAWYELCQS